MHKIETSTVGLFDFGVSSLSTASNTVQITPPGSSKVIQVPVDEFQRRYKSVGRETLISQIPMTAPGSPLSLMLQPPHIVEQLEYLPLSVIVSQFLRTHRIVSADTDREYFSWSLHRHITTFNYVHPQGWVAGTPEYESWRESMQKQYALLLSARQFAEDKYRELSDNTKRTRPETTTRTSQRDFETEHALKQWKLVQRRIGSFRLEQQILRKAFRKSLSLVCDIERKQGHSTGLQDSGIRMSLGESGDEYHDTIQKGLLNSNLKRKANPEPHRHRHILKPGGHWLLSGRMGFAEASRTRLKDALEHGILQTPPRKTTRFRRDPSETEETACTRPRVLEHGPKITQNWELEDVFVDSKILSGEALRKAEEEFRNIIAGSSRHRGSVAILHCTEENSPSAAQQRRLLATPMETNSSESSEAKGFILPSLPASTPEELPMLTYSATKAIVGALASGSPAEVEGESDAPIKASQAVNSHTIAMSYYPIRTNARTVHRQFNEIEHILADMSLGMQEVKAVEKDIAVAMAEKHVNHVSTFEEMNAMIPDEGVPYITLVDDFESSFTDTSAGIGALREMIEKAGCHDSETDRVFKRD